MRKLLLTMLAVASTFLLNAQTEDKKWNIGVFGGSTMYNGDLGNGFYNPDQAFYGNGGLSLSRYISNRFDVNLQGAYGQVGYVESATSNFRAQLLQGNLNLRFKFCKEESHIRPYLFVGVAVLGFQDKYTVTSKTTEFGLPTAGLGFNFRLSETVSIMLQGTYMYSTGDDIDGEKGGNNDSYLNTSMGLTFNFGKKHDADMDGVSDKKDKCPGTPAGVAVDVNGCPLDKDGDGIPDYLDACPDVKGVASAKGCPDKDGDSVVDDKDACPDVAGPVDLNGCPDRDGDRVIDKDDKCPDVKGLVALQGCPDRDGDGVIDSQDKCPDVKGPAATQGCPDRDGDGVYDMDDKCPDVPGIAANKGCPEVSEDVKAVFKKALQGIEFETGKDVIRKKSYGVLDNVAKIMNENPAYLLLINGYTDNVGKSESNMILSQKRADAVELYLIKKGVDTNRMTPTGFGDTKPVADNKTAAGRAQNRRVEFIVEF